MFMQTQKAALSNLLDVPQRPGQWGVVISCMAASGWLAALIIDPSFPTWRSPLLLALTFAPRWAVVVWLTCVVILPPIGIAYSHMSLRAISVGMALVTWLYMSLCSIAMAPPFPAGIGFYIGLAFCCINAESRYWFSRQRTR